MHPELKLKINLLIEYLDDVIPYTKISTEELMSNKEKLAAMERWYLLMVDEAIDINSALMYQIGNKIAESYKSTFYELVPLGIIDQSFADKIALSVKARNELTHNYEKKQKSEIVSDMKKFVELYKEYAEILSDKFLKNEYVMPVK